MNSKFNETEKQAIIDRHLTGGEPVSAISLEAGIPRSTLYAWIKQHREKQANGKPELTLKNFRLLENRVKRLERIIEILKTAGCSASDPLEVKLPALEALHGRYSVHMLCEALNVPRGTFFAISARTLGMPNAERNFALKSNASMMTAIRYSGLQRSARS